MFQAIAAVIGAAFNFATGINNTANAQYVLAQQQLQGRLDYARSAQTLDTNTYYIVIGLIAFIVIAVIVAITVTSLKG